MQFVLNILVNNKINISNKNFKIKCYNDFKDYFWYRKGSFNKYLVLNILYQKYNFYGPLNPNFDLIKF